MQNCGHLQLLVPALNLMSRQLRRALAICACATLKAHARTGTRRIIRSDHRAMAGLAGLPGLLFRSVLLFCRALSLATLLYRSRKQAKRYPLEKKKRFGTFCRRLATTDKLIAQDGVLEGYRDVRFRPLLANRSRNGSLIMKRNIYTRQEAFWCVVRLRTPSRF